MPAPLAQFRAMRMLAIFKWTIYFLVLSVSTEVLAQTVVMPPADISCTSKDLEVTQAVLPAPATDPCSCSGKRKLFLGIINKTGSNRTAFAMWGTLVRKDPTGKVLSTETIFACAPNILKNSTKLYETGKEITIACNESLEINDVILAWTSASPGETCTVLENNPSLINPKCGRVASIRVETGVNASAAVTDASCSAGGTVKVTPFGGVGPYTVVWNNISRPVPIGGSTTFTNVPAGEQSITITDSKSCSNTIKPIVGAPPTVVAAAGDDFKKTCLENASGKQIGEASASGFSYAWTPATGLSATNISNPTANPTSTTTYKVVKTNTATGCTDEDEVVVTVDKPNVTAVAGSNFDITCTSNPNGKKIGEATQTGYTYTWTPAAGLSVTDESDPFANPTTTTTYKVVKLHTSSGCSSEATVLVTVNKPTVTAAAGGDFAKTCTDNTSGKQIGEASQDGYSYTWAPTAGLSASNVSNPTANPTTTTTYKVTKLHIASGCSDDDEITVTVNNTVPQFTVCIVQPTLCANSGSVTFSASGGTGLEYSINNGGSYQGSNVFNNLASGSVTGFKVKNSFGCIGTATCDIVSNCGEAKMANTMRTETYEVAINLDPKATVNAAPNPFNDRIRFQINSSVSGRGKLELFNLSGQKVKTVFEGNVEKGQPQTIEYLVPNAQRSNLIYIFSVGNERATGKLLNQKQ